MKKFFILLLILALIAVPVSAVEGTVVHQGYDSSGRLHQIVNVASLENYYYIDGVKQVGSGLVFVAGNYYFVRSSGVLAYGNYQVSDAKSNGLLPAAIYNFSSTSYGAMDDPPSMPDNWESEWFDSWPPPTEPTVPTDPVEPDVVPTVPIDPDINTDMSFVPGILGIMTQIVTVPGVWFLSILQGSGLSGIFLAAFFVFMVVRTLLAPVLGHSGSDTAKRTRYKGE